VSRPKDTEGRIALDLFGADDMSDYVDRKSGAAFAEGRSFSSRVLFKSFVDTVSTWLRRRRERQELLDYLATDHRAENDICISGSDAREWAERPFWRP
jgi:uncharacterized protein YjiS (DUF1127 family)